MATFRIYYTVTRAGYSLVEAENLQDAIKKWEDTFPVEDGEGGSIEYDPYTQEYFDWTNELWDKEKENGN